MAKICPNCGEKVSDDARFCSSCGIDIEAALREDAKPTKEQRKIARRLAKERAKEHKNRGDDLSSRLRAEKKQQAKKGESQKEARRRAKTVQDCIGFENIWPDGVAMVEEGLFAQTIYVPDVNFRAARPDEQDRIWNLLCSFYNSFTPEVTVQLTILNRVTDASNRFDEIKLPHTGKPYEDGLVDDYNDMLKLQVAKVGRNEIVRQRYFTFSMPALDHDSALVSLSSVVNSALDLIEQMGSRAHVLNGSEYLALVGYMMRPEDNVDYDLAELDASGIDVKDAISPTGLDFTPDGTSGKNDAWKAGASVGKDRNGVVTSDLWYQTLQFRDPFPATMDPTVLGALIALPINMVLTIQVHPTEQAEAINLVQKKLSFMKSQEAHEGKAAAKEGLDPVVSRSITLTQNLSEGTDVLDALMNRNEKLFTTTMLITTWDRSRANLGEKSFQIAQEANKKIFHLAVPKFQLRDAMNTMLPFANDYMAWNRKLLTTELATFLPFVTQEISDKGGVFYGNNKLSGNMIILNRKRLAAPMGWIMGKPGSGKSFAAKQEIFDTAIAHPDDDIFVIDPKGEYAYLTEKLGGQVIDLAADSTSHINPFDLSDAYAPDGTDPMVFKSAFVTSLIAALIGEKSMTPRMLSLIDKNVAISYEYVKRNRPGHMPTLYLFWNLLKANHDELADELRAALEIYVTGTLKTFAFESNVDINRRIVDFNMKRLNGNLRLFGQLVAVDAVWNRTTRNHEEGKRTWIYIDEAQNFFDSKTALEYFTKYWAEGRSYGLIPTGITQNADRIVHHEEAKHMFSNSEFVELLSQAPNDLIDIQNLFNLSDQQASAIKNSRPGEGLLIAGGSVIPFRNEFPKDTALYDIMDTDPNAAEEKRRQSRAGGRL